MTLFRLVLDDLEVLYTDVGGIELAYAAVGEGPMTVVRVPPLGGSLDVLGEVARAARLTVDAPRSSTSVIGERRGVVL